jgi:hypothetical protein
MSDTSYKNTIALAIDIERGAIKIYTPFGGYRTWQNILVVLDWKIKKSLVFVDW